MEAFEQAQKILRPQLIESSNFGPIFTDVVIPKSIGRSSSGPRLNGYSSRGIFVCPPSTLGPSPA
jgi:hypothetical protein